MARHHDQVPDVRGSADDVHPDDVPAGFAVRAPGWIPIGIAFVAVLNLAQAMAGNTVSLFLAILLAFAALAQRSWRAEVRPEGLRFRNRVGVDWERAWSDLRPDVRVQRPGRFGSLVRGRLRTGRRVTVPNGVVTALGGGRVAPDTAQQLMQAWADRGTDAEGGDAA